ncbi:MAG TPA: hypothetical protein PKM88_13740 [bacterium]|nr:hypothetical protein [bacterium]
MAADDPAFEVACPHCKHLLTVDPASREVLECREPAKVKKSLADLMAEQNAAKDKRAAAFQQAVESEKTKRERLQAKFRQALATAESAPPDAGFPRDIDL